LIEVRRRAVVIVEHINISAALCTLWKSLNESLYGLMEGLEKMKGLEN